MFDFLVTYCHLVKDYIWRKILVEKIGFSSLKFVIFFPSSERGGIIGIPLPL